MSENRTSFKLTNESNSLPISEGRLRSFSEDPIACMRKMKAEHGNLSMLTEQGQGIVFALGPVWNQPVLSDPVNFYSQFFAVRGPRNSPQRRLTSGLLSMNGEQHRQQRRMVMEPFSRKSFQHYFQSINFLCQELLESWEPGQTVDMLEEMTQFMLRVTSGMLFGLDDPEMAYKLGTMLDEWVHMNHEIGMGAFVSDPDFTKKYDELLEMAVQLEEQLRIMLARKRSHTDSGNDVLSILMRAHEEEGRLDEEKLIGNAALLFGAAHLTTAHTLTWTTFLLTQHPEVMRELHVELQAGIETNPETTNSTETVLDRVIKESMRVLPASSYSQRVCMSNMQMGPFQLKRGTPVVFSQFMTHHMPELFEEPDRFLPDRWLSIKPSPYAYLPFGTGPRMCIGGPLALVILKMVLPQMLSRYKLSMQPGAEINARVVSTMLGPTTSVPMLIERQDGEFQANRVTGTIHDLVDLPEKEHQIRQAA